MVSFSLWCLVAAVSASITLTNALPVRPPSHNALDECGHLASKNGKNLTVSDVSACYNAIPYDPKIGESVIQTVYNVFNNYYIFRDSALNPDLKAPFTSPPVDILHELQKIHNASYTSDYKFHSDIISTLNSLHDAHVSYSAKCYRSFEFIQPLHLFAPVVDTKQSVQVIKSFQQYHYEGCSVLTIDGYPALSYLQSFSDSISLSKDAGVRLNQALANLVYSPDMNQYFFSAGSFSERTTPPKNDNVVYQLRCPNSESPFNVTIPWEVVQSTQTHFDSTESFVANVCVGGTTKNQLRKRDNEDKINPLLPVFKKSSLYDIEEEEPINLILDAPAANYSGKGNATLYFRLTEPSDVGVIVVHTHQVDDEEGELNVLSGALDYFESHNITKILFDFSGNTGGSVNFASTLVQFFFPNKTPYDKILPSDLRITRQVQDLGKAIYNHTGNGGLYNAYNYYEFETGARYADSSLFTNFIESPRNGRTAAYTNSTGLVTDDLKFKKTYPWTNNAANIRILSDGRCGSSCALSTHFLNSLYNVTAYSVGGIQNQPLSIFSFAGGSVSSLDQIQELFGLGNMKSPLSSLPYQGGLGFPLLEVFARGSSVPLEYDYASTVAEHHIDYNINNAKSRPALWTEVALDAWK
ncbi:hypothetical protein BGZ76_011658 [Entomortierella beljakovae]|nr:hypothetical protein BGZ76_011658 [Entomortierella beljakovae]